MPTSAGHSSPGAFGTAHRLGDGQDWGAALAGGYIDGSGVGGLYTAATGDIVLNGYDDNLSASDRVLAGIGGALTIAPVVPSASRGLVAGGRGLVSAGQRALPRLNPANYTLAVERGYVQFGTLGGGVPVQLTYNGGLRNVTKNTARYGNAQQRQALLNQVRASRSLSEAKGVVHAFHQMKHLGYELQDVSLHYRGFQGVDLIFHNGSRHAIVEAKHGKYLSSLDTYSGGLRQGSLDYNISRLERYLRFGDGTHGVLAQNLPNEARIGQLDSFAAFYRSNRVMELPIGWPNVPAIQR